MALSDEKLAAKIEVIRRDQSLRIARRAGGAVPAHVVSDEVLDIIAGSLNEANLRRTWLLPGYLEAARNLALESLPESADNAILMHALRDVSRFGSAVWALSLHAQPGGLTVARFNAVAEVLGYGGRTWSHAAFAYLRFIGYIEPDNSSSDRRERRFRPTARMRAAYRDHFVRALRCLAPVDPAIEAYGELLASNDAAFDRYVIATGDMLLTLGLIHRQNTEPTMEVFTRRRNGMPMMWQLVATAPASEKWPTTDWFPISVSDLARRSGSSRAHYQRMLDDAEAAGMIETDGQGRLRIRRRLRIEINTFQGLIIIGFDTVRQVIRLQDAAAESRAA